MGVSFDDSNDAYTLASGLGITHGTGMTCACWFYPIANASEYLIQIGAGSANNHRWNLKQDSDSTLEWAARYEHSDSTETAKSGGGAGSYIHNQWNHAIGRENDEDSRDVFLNGVKFSDGNTLSTFDAPTAIDLGRRGSSTGYAYYGAEMGEAAIWDVPITDAQCMSLFKRFSPPLVRPQNLVFYAPLLNANDLRTFVGTNLTKVDAPSDYNHPPIISPASVFYSIPAAAAVTVPDETAAPTIQLAESGGMIGNVIL